MVVEGITVVSNDGVCASTNGVDRGVGSVAFSSLFFSFLFFFWSSLAFWSFHTARARARARVRLDAIYPLFIYIFFIFVIYPFFGFAGSSIMYIYIYKSSPLDLVFAKREGSSFPGLERERMIY